LERQLAPFFEQDLDNNSLPLLVALCPILGNVASPQVQFDLVFPHFQALSEMAPLRPSSDDCSPQKLLLALTTALYHVLFERQDVDVVYDPDALVRACCLSFVLSDDDAAAWESNIEDFVLNNFCEDPDIGVRQAILLLLDLPGLTEAILSVTKEMMGMSSMHQEAAFHLLFSLLSRNTPDEFIVLERSNPIEAGRYLVCVSHLGWGIDHGAIERKRVAVSIVEMISILGRVDELFEFGRGESMPLIMDVLKFADSRDVGLDLLAALVTEHPSLPIAPSVFDRFMHSVQLGNFDKDLLQPIFPLIAFFTRSGFGESLLPVVMEMLDDTSIKSELFHCFASVIVAFAANGTDEATAVLLQAALARP
jgi:hypothetical protein